MFSQIYDKELARLEEKLRPLQKFDENLVKVDQIYEDVRNLMERKSSVELLAQMQDIATYIDRSSFELKRIFNA